MPAAHSSPDRPAGSLAGQQAEICARFGPHGGRLGLSVKAHLAGAVEDHQAAHPGIADQHIRAPAQDQQGQACSQASRTASASS